MSLVKQMENITNKWSDLSFEMMWGMTRKEWIKEQLKKEKEGINKMDKNWCIFDDNTKEVLERFNSCTEAQKEVIKYILNDN